MFLEGNDLYESNRGIWLNKFIYLPPFPCLEKGHIFYATILINSGFILRSLQLIDVYIDVESVEAIINVVQKRVPFLGDL